MVKDIKILKATQKQLLDFSNLCKKTEGEINIFVHPFYSENTTPTKNKRYVTKKYLKNRDKYIKECLESNTPTIFFQQKSDYQELPKRLDGFGNHIIYTVQTKDGEETPIGGRRDWDKLAEILSNSGIGLVTVSGLYLVNIPIKSALKEFDIKYDKEKIQIEFIDKIPIHKNKYPNARVWLEKDFVPTGCVGYTVMNLLRYNFDVSFGKLTAPD